MDFLLPAAEMAVAEKRAKDQMAGYDGEHWLAVTVEGNAAAQLEEACAPEQPGTAPDLSSVQFDGCDELWVIGCTFHEGRYAVARFKEPGQQPTLLTVPRPPHPRVTMRSAPALTCGFAPPQNSLHVFIAVAPRFLECTKVLRRRF